MPEEFSLPEKSAFSIQEISEYFSTDIETVHYWLEEGLLFGCVKHAVGSSPQLHGQHLPKLVVTKDSLFEQIDVEYEDGKLWRLSAEVVTQLIVEGGIDRSRINASLDGSQIERKHHFNGFRFEASTIEPHEYEEYRVFMYNAPKISLTDVLISRVERDRFKAKFRVGNRGQVRLETSGEPKKVITQDLREALLKTWLDELARAESILGVEIDQQKLPFTKEQIFSWLKVWERNAVDEKGAGRTVFSISSDTFNTFWKDQKLCNCSRDVASDKNKRIQNMFVVFFNANKG